MSRITISRVIELYNEGVLLRQEAIFEIVSRLGAEEVQAAVFPSLPDEWRSLVTEKVQSAPASDDEWAKYIIVCSYCGPDDGIEEFERRKRESLIQYRAGVEAIRAYLKTTRLGLDVGCH